MVNTNTPILSAENLHSYYGNSHILTGIDFAINEGEAVALMGRNGMGKSTLIKTMLGIVRARKGVVRVRGQEMTRQPTYNIIRQGIAYVPEGRGIFANLSVKENLLMSARAGLRGQVDWTFSRVLDSFPRLGERINFGGGQLSGGEQQMLTIGRALMTNPDLLILDEATEGLAPLIAREIWRMVRTICETGMAVIIVDKNHAALTSITDRAVILVKGKVVYDNDCQALRKNSEIIHQHLGV